MNDRILVDSAIQLARVYSWSAERREGRLVLRNSDGQEILSTLIDTDDTVARHPLRAAGMAC